MDTNNRCPVEENGNHELEASGTGGAKCSLCYQRVLVEDESVSQPKFQGQFNLADPNIAAIVVPQGFPNPDLHKVVVFDMEQAKCLFSLGLDQDRIKVYAIREKDMQVRVIMNVWEATEFFGE